MTNVNKKCADKCTCETTNTKKNSFTEANRNQHNIKDNTTYLYYSKLLKEPLSLYQNLRKQKVLTMLSLELRKTRLHRRRLMHRKLKRLLRRSIMPVRFISRQ
jgi:hypothetical protein